MKEYTICFLKWREQILLLKRAKMPHKGLWNGVGGKIECDETPVDSAIREVFEETNITIGSMDLKGIVEWKSTDFEGKAYLFYKNLPESFNPSGPRDTREGLLEWKPISWILESNTTGVVEDLTLYLPYVLSRQPVFHYTFEYVDNHSFSFSKRLATLKEKQSAYKSKVKYNQPFTH